MISQLILLNLSSLFAAYFLDIYYGDPDIRLHPVRLLGRLIAALEKRYYIFKDKFEGGIILLIGVLLTVFTVSFVLLFAAYSIHPLLYFIFNTIIVYFAISIKSMCDHAARVYNPLAKGDVKEAQRELSMIVSRDTGGMKSEDIVRSAVESVSENFTDGVVSPMFYSALFGGVGAAVFKGASTLDSMVGYRNEKYELFGKASAVFDDILNFIPARLSVGVIMLGGLIKGISIGETYESVSKYRLAHPSPNAAHSMSAFSGALGVTLGGPVSYFGRVKDKPKIGDGERELLPDLINESVSLFKASAFAAVSVFSLFPALRIML